MPGHSTLPGHPSREASTPSRPAEPRRWLTPVAVTLIAVAVLSMVLLLPRYLLSWDLAGGAVRPGDRAPAVNAIRSTLMQGLAGVAVLVGAFFTWRQLQVARQGQVTDRYTRAIEQLGQDSPELRVGAIYALERIAGDSAMDRLTIADVLATFIRVRSPLTPGTDERQRPLDLSAKLAAARSIGPAAPLRDRAPQIQAAITVLGRMPGADKRSRGWLARVDLAGSDLGYGDLAGADLHYSDLSGSFLLGVDLRRADLTGVWFVRAMLDRARLHQADLRSAVLWQARLAGADLRATDLTTADLTGAHLHGTRLDLADLRGADFSGTDFAGATFPGALADDTTIWPSGFDPQQAGVLPADEAPPFRPQKWSEDL
jgi:Pentapeptide repeats (8 copies)